MRSMWFCKCSWHTLVFTVLLYFFQTDSTDGKQMKSKKLEKEKKPPSEPTVDPTDKVST